MISAAGPLAELRMNKPIRLIDTNIFIDLMRNYAPAVQGLHENTIETFSIPVIVPMALGLGARSKQELQKITRLIDGFATEHIHAVRTRLPIYTRNARHFRLFEAVEVNTPYT
ncbi:MAG: hypothetical protein OHK0046_50570 [Anaerolineae bacterium]